MNDCDDEGAHDVEEAHGAKVNRGCGGAGIGAAGERLCSQSRSNIGMPLLAGNYQSSVSILRTVLLSLFKYAPYAHCSQWGVHH